MYSFKRITIDQKVWDEDISGYVKYIGYVIPIMHGLRRHVNCPTTVTIEGKEYECPHIKELSTIYHFGKKNWVPVNGIFANITHRECAPNVITGDYGCITVYRSNNEVIKFLEMLRDDLFSTPYYMYWTRDMGVDENALKFRNDFAYINAGVYGKPCIEDIPRNKNPYHYFHVDIDELNAFIQDIRNGNIDFSVERITSSTSTNPIEREPKTSAPKKFTWRWSV